MELLGARGAHGGVSRVRTRRPGSRPLAIRLARGAGAPELLAALIVGGAAIALSGTLAFCAAEVVLLLVLAAWRLRAAVAALMPLPALTVMMFHSLVPTVVAIVTVGFATLLEVIGGRARPSRSQLWIAALAGALLISWLFPTVRLEQSGLPGQFLLMAGLGLLVLAIAMVAAPGPGVLLRAMAIVGVLASLYALTRGDQYTGGRIGAMALNPNYFGAYLTLPIVASLGLAWRRRNPLWLLAVAACVAGLVATQSRGASLAVLAGVIFLVSQNRSRLWRTVISVIVMAALAVSFNSFGTIIDIGAGNRPAAELIADTAIRSRVIGFLLDVIAAHPLRGIGFSQFAAYAAAAPGLGIYIAATNEYLLLAAETGLLALVVLLVLLWCGIKPRRAGDMAVIRAVAFTYAIDMLFLDTLSTLVSIVPFWLCLGLLIGQTAGSEPPASSRPGEQMGRVKLGVSG